MTLVGGMRRLLWPVVGTLIVGSMQSYLSAQFVEWVIVLQGVIHTPG